MTARSDIGLESVADLSAAAARLYVTVGGLSWSFIAVVVTADDGADDDRVTLDLLYDADYDITRQFHPDMVIISHR